MKKPISWEVRHGKRRLRRAAPSEFKEGFSLIEISIVIGIMAILSTLLISYNRSSDNQIVLGVEQAKVTGFLNRAKAFALERKSIAGIGNVCAFGVHFDKDTGTMALFSAAPAESGACSSSFSSGTEIENVVLDNRVKFAGFICEVPTSCVSYYDVTFEFPYLTAINPGKVIIGVKNGTVTKFVEIGAGGEITAL